MTKNHRRQQAFLAVHALVMTVCISASVVCLMRWTGMIVRSLRTDTKPHTVRIAAQHITSQAGVRYAIPSFTYTSQRGADGQRIYSY